VNTVFLQTFTDTLAHSPSVWMLFAALSLLAGMLGYQLALVIVRKQIKTTSFIADQLAEAERVGQFGSFLWDYEKGTVFWSDGMFNLFGIMTRRVPDIPQLASYAHPQDRKEAELALQRVLATPGPFSCTFRVVAARDGALRHIQFQGVTKLKEGKGALQVRGLARDISKEVTIDREKSEFVSLAAHQLKSPLAGIITLADGLLTGIRGTLSEEQAQYASRIRETGGQMMAMVSDLLSISRIELGTLVIKPEALDVAAFANALVAEHEQFAREHAVTVKLIASQLPAMEADRQALRMILQNLLTNAIKYSTKGGIVEVEISRGLVGETILVRVSDTGIGIPKSEHNRVFEKLHRAQNAVANVPDGTGLGLYLVKTLVDHIKGSVTFESEEGKGTTFFVTLPTVWAATVSSQSTDRKEVA